MVLLGLAVLAHIVLSPFLFWDALLNAPKKNRLFDEYLCMGRNARGLITRVVTTIHRTNFIETHRTYKASYAYRAPGTTEIYSKPAVDIPPEAVSRFIGLKVLPEYPMSGYPSIFLKRNAFSRAWVILYFPLSGLFCLGIVSLIVTILLYDDNGECVDSDEDECNKAFYILCAVIFPALHFAGYQASKSAYKGWKNTMLESCCEMATIRSQRNPSAGVSADRYTNVPLEENTEIPSAQVISILEEEEEGLELREQDDNPENIGVRAVPVAVSAEAVVLEEREEVKLYDASEDDPQSNDLRKAMRDRDWEFLRDFFKDIRDDVTKKEFYISVISSSLETEWKKTSLPIFSKTLDAWSSKDPENPDCRLVRGCCSISFAWHARSAKLARHVDADAWPKFFERLDLASQELERARKLNPSDAVVYSYLITVARGKEGRRESEVVSLLESVKASNDPHNLRAHSSALQFFCYKWGGSYSKMFAFARGATANLPEGHPLWILILQAHFEMRMSLAILAREAKSRQAFIAHQLYWKNPDVRQEVLRSYHQYVGSANLEAPTSPAKVAELMSARNWYAYCLAETGDHDMARREFHAIGARPTEYPWSYYGDPVTEYQEACDKLGVCF